MTRRPQPTRQDRSLLAPKLDLLPTVRECVEEGEGGRGGSDTQPKNTNGRHRDKKAVMSPHGEHCQSTIARPHPKPKLPSMNHSKKMGQSDKFSAKMQPRLEKTYNSAILARYSGLLTKNPPGLPKRSWKRRAPCRRRLGRTQRQHSAWPKQPYETRCHRRVP